MKKATAVLLVLVMVLSMSTAALTQGNDTENDGLNIQDTLEANLEDEGETAPPSGEASITPPESQEEDGQEILAEPTGLPLIAPMYLLVGDGTSSSPYLIKDEEDLRNVWQMGLGAHYKLMADITLTSDWMPIGRISTQPFTGTFDGNNHTISNINVTQGATNGFFGFVNNAIIRDLHLADVTIEGSEYDGGFAGHVYNGTQITGCTVKNANVSSTTLYAGGFAGAVGNSTITNCNVTYAVIDGHVYAGGFAGYMSNTTVAKTYAVDVDVTTQTGSAGGHTGYMTGSGVSESFSAGKVHTDKDLWAGGFAGLIQDGSIVSNSYTTCDVEARFSSDATSTFVGAFAGQVYNNSRVLYTYASGEVKATNAAGFIGQLYGYYKSGSNYNYAYLYNSFTLSPKVTTNHPRPYRLLLSNVNYISLSDNYALDIGEHYNNEGFAFRSPDHEYTNSYSGQSISLADAKRRITYENNAAWDFDDIWDIDEDNGYPFLQFAGDIAGGSVPGGPGTPAPSGLDKPSKLTVEEVGSKLYLSWDKVKNATSYEVYINGVKTVTTGTRLEISANMDMDCPLTVYVVAVNTAERSAESMEITINATSVIPNNPKDAAVNLLNDPRYFKEVVGGEASVSSAASNQRVGKAIDGNMDTRWVGNSLHDNVEAEFEFQMPVTLNEIVIYEFQNRIASYSIYYYNNDTAQWIKIVDVPTKPNGQNQTFTHNGFGTITTNKLKFEFNKHVDRDGIGIRELEVYYK